METDGQMTQPQVNGGQPPLPHINACHELQARPWPICPLLASLDGVKGFRVSPLPPSFLQQVFVKPDTGLDANNIMVARQPTSLPS